MAKDVIKQVNDYIEKIIESSLEDIVSERFARYSKYIIQDRALPDARDGLKPVQRRILYAMQQLGMFHNKPYKKSARIAGEVMGKYHPHGDSSIYEAMVRLSQDFKMRVPLIDMHGNNGSIDGDSAAAMRYTEARLSKAAEALLGDIDKRTVPFVPNFDDEELEPVVLPAKFPNLLVNGAKGISAGYATNIPPHNLREVVDATLAYIDNENLTVEEVSQIIKGPDFPTGGIVQGHAGILQAIETGSGKVVIRSKSKIEEISKSQDRIVITEIPYEINKADLVKSMDLFRIDKKVEDILEIRDESDQEGLRIAIDLKKGADAQLILNLLFKSTDLQVAYNYNMVSIMNHRPVLVGVLPVLKAYVDHQKDVITNRSNYELAKATKRQHIVLGLIKMVSVIEEVVKIIRNSQNKQNAKENIMSAFGFTEIQAEAIVTLQLYRLSNTDIIALEQESIGLSERIKELEHILSSEAALRRVIKRELTEMSDALGEDRKSEIEAEIENIRIDQKDLVSDEKVMIGVTKDGYIKRASTRSYQASQSCGLKENDALMFEVEVNTLDTLLIFTNLGNYVFLPVYKIDEQKWKDLGIYINNIVPIEKNETIIKVLPITSFKDDQNILIATKEGMMKQAKLADFEVTRYTKTIRCMKLSDNDEVISVDLGEKVNILSVSMKGYALRFKTDDLPLYGLQAGGVKSMSLQDGDQVAGARYVKQSDDFIILTNRGHVIKDVVEELPLYNRNRRGILIIEHQKANPHLAVSISRMSKQQQKENIGVRIIGEKGAILLTVADLKYTGNKFGKKIFEEADLGRGYLIDIFNAMDEKDEKKNEKVTKKKVEPIETIDLVKEEIIEIKDKKIHLNRLDLFDEDE
ncbi:MAG: DNA topoisomerase IV subunit A [Acholeplasmataceae bacterium]|jgi:topoisomerase-4 subunit A|nr:DNA topoisomerase IV subunit A [Acholeplasmataceae bacterium]